MAREGRIWIDRRTVGGPERKGRIVEVLGEPGHERYRVRWQDGRETIVYPGSDARLPARPRPAPAPGPGARPRKRAPEPESARPGPKAAAGDRLVIRAHHLGEPERDAEILEVLGPDGTPPYRVRWQDTGSEGLYFPGSDAVVEHFEAKPRAKKKTGSR